MTILAACDWCRLLSRTSVISVSDVQCSVLARPGPGAEARCQPHMCSVSLCPLLWQSDCHNALCVLKHPGLCHTALCYFRYFPWWPDLQDVQRHPRRPPPEDRLRRIQGREQGRVQIRPQRGRQTPGEQLLSSVNNELNIIAPLWSDCRPRTLPPTVLMFTPRSWPSASRCWRWSARRTRVTRPRAATRATRRAATWAWCSPWSPPPSWSSSSSPWAGSGAGQARGLGQCDKYRASSSSSLNKCDWEEDFLNIFIEEFKRQTKDKRVTKSIQLLILLSLLKSLYLCQH